MSSKSLFEYGIRTLKVSSTLEDIHQLSEQDEIIMNNLWYLRGIFFQNELYLALPIEVTCMQKTHYL